MSNSHFCTVEFCYYHLTLLPPHLAHLHLLLVVVLQFDALSGKESSLFEVACVTYLDCSEGAVLP
jgi:hypothetical protein